MMPPNFTPQQVRRARREQSESLTVPQQQKTVVSFLGWTFAYTMHTLNSRLSKAKGQRRDGNQEKEASVVRFGKGV